MLNFLLMRSAFCRPNNQSWRHHYSETHTPELGAYGAVVVELLGISLSAKDATSFYQKGKFSWVEYFKLYAQLF